MNKRKLKPIEYSDDRKRALEEIDTKKRDSTQKKLHSLL